MPPSHRAVGPNGATSMDAVIAEFGREVARKLRTKQGSPEDHLRGPFERMLSSVATSLGLTITTVGETRLPDLSIRPDYAIDVAGGRVGYVELKKPGNGVPGSWPSPSAHDRNQWEKLRLLPNVLYADGEQFARYKFGKLQGKVARLEPGLDRAGDRLRAVGTDFARVVTDFLLWEPERPRSIGELVRLVANLCRLLRDDVAAELIREQSGLSRSQTFNELATDWRQVLFPNLSDAEFADQYAQTITFSLLLARVEGVSFHGRSIGEIARLLGKQHSLMGRALTVLTDQPEEEHSVALTTMIRVFSVVDWADFPNDSYAVLYEDFLAAYDPKLRRKSGVYYTPAPLVSFMTRIVDDLLRTRLDRRLGFAERDVIVVDPAMGTGSFLAEVINCVAATVATEEGLGAVAPRLRELSNRLIGFEHQAAPYAVAELRIHGLLKKRHRAEVPPEERRFLADALDDPDVQLLPMGRMYDAIGRSRRGANRAKREEPVMVVIGNPPYLDKVKGSALWIENRNSLQTAPSLAAFRKPGNGRLEYVLSNKYIYFWRWATWKTFDAHPAHSAGVVAMVCSAGFTKGPGFAGMREYMRRTADEGWIIDLSPEGHRPPMNSRFFRGNQQPICVAIFIRNGKPNPDKPARIYRTQVTGTVEEKASALGQLRTDGVNWEACIDGWTDPFQSAGEASWNSLPKLTDLMPWATPGVKPNRTWVYAPEQEILRKRWERLISAPVDERPELLRETRDIKVDSKASAVSGMTKQRGAISAEQRLCPQPQRVAHRPFDRKWIIPDPRLIDWPRSSLWASLSSNQVFVIEQHAHPISGGPALLLTPLVPDMHSHSGRGGRVLPLYRNAGATVANITPGLLQFLTATLRHSVTASQLLAYLAAVAAHPGYTHRFSADLRTPGIRVPLTRDITFWTDAVRLGQQVIWLHSYGERYFDPTAGRDPGPPKMRTNPPIVRVGIPDTEERMPERIKYEGSTQTLHVGDGEIASVTPEIWNYKVSGMRVVKHWFDYRKKKPAGKRGSPLNDTVATIWTSAMTTELLELLNMLGRCVELEPRQDSLLEQIANGPLITTSDLAAGGVLPVPPSARTVLKMHPQGDPLFGA